MKTTTGYGPGSPVAKLSTAASERTPFLAADGALWLAIGTSPTLIGSRIHRAAPATTTFGDPTLVDLQTPDVPSITEDSPVLTTDGLTLYFASTRPLGEDRRIWRARRSSSNSPFAAPTLVPELAPTPNLFLGPTSISADQCELYFHRLELSGAGSFKIYRARR